MKTLIERLENDIAFAGKGPAVVRVGDLRALIAAHKALREAARALVADLDNPKTDAMTWCEAAFGEDDYLCSRPATQAFLYESLCDEHAAQHRADHPKLTLASVDKSYAAPLRALRAALKEGP